ncbi:alpha/beta hydrolase [Leptospira sp. 2 VSF19]|uniref:Alpha/beta hydrolase n=1 Tax=Leptospira soteropolitanensis TaxID=2950025 RepID=A0AAW5VLH9_9LEPT|nr:alpha/beta hydrolase [Leptospira soteropolitanensis]MCW7491875.1 alpha/beta hydrolase [Leptospira soteropolitanensis]MCW7499459.1 alpha/beta hydrolase [Leptospira soteropolitanensis]MCW7520950.1 alpha/beta hydrolase [Leptospira soteropolitanensis]MCW7525563.1 alpha/beta hydrolase [Leptospira soteropolitanensis]MCW7529429.1 alpha/beta hydrolase [Leptospira soteropolitanensis]
MTLEIIESGAPLENARGAIILWPSTGGNARSFRIRDGELETLGLRLIRFNPPSHGNSKGVYDPKTAIQLIDGYVKKNGYKNKDLYGIGHSGGGAALMMYAKEVRFQKLFLLSPILDSVLSLRHLYESNSIEEFSRLLLLPGLSDDLAPNKQILETLSSPEWLETEKVGHLKVPIQNSRIRLEDLSLFLKNLFLPGFVVDPSLIQKRTDYTIFLPNEDKWFPKEYTTRFAKENGLSCIEISEAPDHFFSSSWLRVWKQIKTIGFEKKASD